MVKQKQSQRVVINIGETKPKRRAPRRKALPRGGAPPRPGGGPGGAGAGGAPSMPSDFFPRGPPTIILPNRAGPIVDSTTQLQQLIKPFEQQLLRLEQAVRPLPPSRLPYVAEEKQEEKPTMKSIRDYMAQYIESLPMAPEPTFKSASASSSSSTEPLMLETVDRGTQTRRTTTAETGTQYVIDEPPQPLVKATGTGTDPLVDNVRPVSEKPKKVQIDEESDEEKKPSPPKAREEEPLFYSAGDIQRLRDQGKITRDFLNKLQKKESNPRGLNLLKIARKLGLVISKEQEKLTKADIINLILDEIK